MTKNIYSSQKSVFLLKIVEVILKQPKNIFIQMDYLVL